MPRFIHPIHARGLRSPSISPPLTKLTDKKIDGYILAGRYGSDMKERLEERMRQKKKKSKVKGSGKLRLSDFNHLL